MHSHFTFFAFTRRVLHLVIRTSLRFLVAEAAFSPIRRRSRRTYFIGSTFSLQALIFAAFWFRVALITLLAFGIGQRPAEPAAVEHRFTIGLIGQAGITLCLIKETLIVTRRRRGLILADITTVPIIRIHTDLNAFMIGFITARLTGRFFSRTRPMLPASIGIINAIPALKTVRIFRKRNGRTDQRDRPDLDALFERIEFTVKAIRKFIHVTHVITGLLGHASVAVEVFLKFTVNLRFMGLDNGTVFRPARTGCVTAFQRTGAF